MEGGGGGVEDISGLWNFIQLLHKGGVRTKTKAERERERERERQRQRQRETDVHLVVLLNTII